MITLQRNKSMMLLVVLACFPLLGFGQFKDFRKLHTENFDPNKWNSGAVQYHENGYTKYEYKDIGKGRKKRFEYYNDGSLMSEMEVIFKSSRDTAVVFDPDTYQEMVQIVENNQILPNGKYLEYHKGIQKGKKLIHLKGKFRDGKKTGTWTTTSLSGQIAKVNIEKSEANVDHTDYGSYKSIQEEKNLNPKRPSHSGNKPKGKITFKKQDYTYVFNGDLYGLNDNQNNEIVSPIYNKISTKYYNKGILILQNEKLHLFDLDSKTITADHLDDIRFDYKLKLFIFTKEGKTGIIDPNTKQITVPAIYNHLQAAKSSYGLDRKVILLYNGKGIDLYYKTKDGNFHLLKEAYQSVSTFSLPKDNYAIVKKNNVTELISLESLKSIFKFKKFQELKISPSLHVFLKSEDSWAVYFKDFTAKNPGKFEGFNYVNNVEAHVEVKQNGLWGALDQKSLDSLIIPCQYDSLSYVSSKKYKSYNKDGKVGLINYEREVLVPMEFEDVYLNYASQNKIWVKENGKYRLYDGEFLGLFDQIISYFDKNYYIVQNEEKQGLYSESDKQMIFPCEYDSIYRLKQGRSSIKWYRSGIALQKDNDLFLADLEGKMLSDYTFSSIVNVPTVCELIAKDHNYKSHVVSTCDPTFELPPIVDSVRHVYEGAYVISNDGKFGFFSSGTYFDFKVSIPIEYEEILWYLDTPADGSKLIMAKKDGKWLWIDPKTGKNNFQYVFDQIDRFYDSGQADKAKVVLDGKKKFLRLNGTLEDR